MAKKTKKPVKKATKKAPSKKKAPAKKKVAAKKAPAKKKATKKSAAKKKAAPKKKAVAKKNSPKKAVKKATPKKAAKKVVAKKAPVKKEAPKNTVAINPYLTFNGNCEEAFNFYKSVFGGNFPYVGRFGEMPPMEGKPIPESEKNKIMHMSLPIGPNTTLMGSDSSDAFGHANIQGNNFSISLNATTQAEADKFYNGLSAGGQQTMPMSTTFWGSYFGMLVDKFGIAWMVSFETGKAK